MENFDELQHYGVKGMKWGVRRDIKRKSRTAARLKDAETRLTKKNERLERSIAKKQNKIADNKRLISVLNPYRKKLVSGISAKDRKQGERYVKGLDIISYPLYAIPIVGPGIAGGIDGRKFDAIGEAIRYSRKKNR